MFLNVPHQPSPRRKRKRVRLKPLIRGVEKRRRERLIAPRTHPAPSPKPTPTPTYQRPPPYPVWGDWEDFYRQHLPLDRGYAYNRATDTYTYVDLRDVPDNVTVGVYLGLRYRLNGW